VYPDVIGVWGSEIVPWTGLRVVSSIGDEYLGGVTAVVNVDAAVVQPRAHSHCCAASLRKAFSISTFVQKNKNNQNFLAGDTATF